ncbi:MAG: DUF4446 family protein [Clostridia bacterium]|nr:DUF4446 family protein [Clostridium sp.]
MENILELLKTDNFLIALSVIVILLVIGLVIVIIKFNKISKKYTEFMKKLGNGKNIEEDLENYMYRVERVEKQNAEILNYIKNVDNDLNKCIQKIGIVRYNAFQDTGSDLSFALALLDEKNNGVVLNGIYSREMSNIYAKPVENGKSKYTISEEENLAIEKAINGDGTIRVK